ncbi:MAG TPA: 2TM domain-containing protein [Thermomicrobiales bacterium]|nr:2TM domain-containing protein [Thermomicrobiales bacterium]
MQQSEYDRARARVQALRGFSMHAITYVLVNLMLVVINLITSPDDLWFYWVTFGWGIALAIHAYAVFGSSRPFGPEWEERKIQEELDRNQGR